MAKKSGIKILKRTLLVIGCFMLIALLSIPFVLPGIVRSRLISYVEEHTENHLEIESIAFTGFHSVELSFINLKPKLGTKAFNKKNGFQSDWIHFTSKHIHIEGIKWYTLFSDKKVYAEQITMDHPDVYVYRDKRIEDAPYKYKALPSQLIRNATFSITVPLLEIKQGHIAYEEHPKDKDSSATLTFDHLYASAYHISTDSIYMEEHPLIIVDGKGSILDSIKAEIKYTSNVLNKNDLFRFEATVHSFSAVHLNQCLSPLAGASIESGDIQKVTLFFDATDDVANGEMKMDYENLKMNILSEKTGKQSKLKSLVANLFVKNEVKVSEAKTEKEEESKSGTIHFERRKDRFIFNYWWNAIKTGVVSIVTPLDEVPQKKTKK